MKLSVITVSFNARDVIRQTLASVTGQTYSDLEYIVIDGGSTDGTQAVIGEYTARIARFVSEPDGGIYFGMNKGIAAATGDFVLFLNAGDRFADERVLEDVAAFIGAHPEADAVFGDSEQVLEYGSYRIKPAPDRLDRSMGISHQAVFVRTDLLRAHPFDVRYRYAADYEQISSLYLDKKVFVYGGNLGKPQGIPFLIECLKKCKNVDDAFFLIVGDGTEYSVLENYVETEKPQNVKLMKRLPKDDYDTMVGACDVGLLFLDHRFTIPNFPSRLLSYMQAKLPVLAATDPNTDIGKVIMDGGFGWWCESNNVDRFYEIANGICTGELRNNESAEHSLLTDYYSSKQSYEIIMGSSGGL